MPKFAIFQISDELFGLPIERVVEIIKLQKVFSVPGLPQFLSGVMSVRGAVIPVLDLRKRFGVEPKGQKERVVIIRLDHERIGFVVDQIKEIIELARDEIKKPPSVFRGFKTEYMQGLGRKGESIIILLDIDSLLTSEEKISMKESIGGIGEGRADGL